MSLVLSLGGCGEERDRSPTGSTGESIAIPEPDQATTIDLLPMVPVSMYGEVSQINFESPAEWRFLSSGWHEMETGEGSEGYAWVGARGGTVDLPLLTPEPKTLRLEMGSILPIERFPTQNVVLRFNGEEIAEVPVRSGRDSFEIELPEGLQHPGLNRLELLPSFWIRPVSASLGEDRRKLSLKVYGVSWKESPSAAAPNSLSREKDAVDETKGDPEELYSQPSGTVVSQFVDLPPANATLVFEAKPVAGGGKNRRPGRLSIHLVDASGAKHVLGDYPAVSGQHNDGFSGEIDLTPYSSPVSINAVYRPLQGSGNEGTSALNWETLRIEGQTHPEATESPGLDGASANILVILFDTLRADYTTPGGAPESATPEIARLASEGVRFEDARSEAPWTRPSIASLFTSLPPEVHGAVREDRALPEDLPSLPELFQKAGYSTVAIFNNSTISDDFGFGRGFDATHDFFKLRYTEIRKNYRTPESQADFVWDRYIDPVAGKAADSPFFVYLHEIDPHAPFEPLPPYDDLDDLKYPGNLDVSGGLSIFFALNSDPGPLEEADRLHLTSLYRGEAAFMDAYLGRLRERLREAGIEKDTLIVFLSDHGEEFLDHGYLGHGYALYDELLRVPLIFHLPGVAEGGRVSEAPVHLGDVAPTLLEIAGIDVPDSFQGRSLVPWMMGEPVSSPRPVFAHTIETLSDIMEPRELQSVTYDGWKLIRRGFGESDPTRFAYELYRVDTAVKTPWREGMEGPAPDPREVVDRWGQYPIIGHTLRQMLERHDFGISVMGTSSVEAESIRPEVIENLRDLGYIR